MSKQKRICIGDIVTVLGIFEYEVIGFDEIHYQCKRTDCEEIHFYAVEQLTLKEKGDE